jgi:hypothetical protein
MHDIIEPAHNVIAGEDHLIIQLLRNIDIRRSAASCSSGTDGDKSRPKSQRSPPPSSRHCFSSGTPNASACAVRCRACAWSGPSWPASTMVRGADRVRMNAEHSSIKPFRDDTHSRH